MKVKSQSEVVQSCPTLHDSMYCSPAGSSAHAILQARVLEWGAIAFSTVNIEVHISLQIGVFVFFEKIVELLDHVVRAK